MAGTGKSKYYEIKEKIMSQILDGEYLPGSQLPSEPKLAEIFNVSRGTIRQALSALEREGLISRRSGIGTIIIRKPKGSNIISFTQQILDKGMKPSTEVLGRMFLMASEAEGRVCEAFLEENDAPDKVQIYCIDRLRFANEMPVSRQIIYLRSSDFGADQLENEKFNTSIFSFYDKYHRRAAWADEIIQARRPTRQEIAMLNMQDLPQNQRLVYERNRITFDDENMPLEVLVSVDRADFFTRYQYRLVTNL